jgi:hypothetical protein
MKIELFKLIKAIDGSSASVGQVIPCYNGLVSGVGGIHFSNREYFVPYIRLCDLERGDKVLCTGNSDFCQDSKETIRKIITKYNEDTGKPYPVIVIGSGQKFHGVKGHALTPPYAYRIEAMQPRA